MKKIFISSMSLLLVVSGLAMAKVDQSKVVNINTADQTTLAATPGIGKSKAKSIVSYRQEHGAFKDVHDLTHVKGISEKSLQNILKRNPDQIVIS